MTQMPISQEKQRKIEQARNANCTELDLSNDFYTGDADKLTEIPSEIFELTHLQKLNLSGNKINYLPSEISKLEKLTHLDISFNELQNLPEEIGKLTKLLELKLSQNQIASLPNNIGSLNSLQILFLDSNRLNDIPEEIINSTNNYLTINLEKNLFQEYVYYKAKLMIIGEPDTGKTSLRQKIIGENYEFQNNHSETEGIDIIPWSFSKNNKKYKINIWDFARKEIEHGTYKFFFTDNSLYLLVTKNNNSNLDNWLELIKSLSPYPNSRVLIIKNEQDNIKYDIDEIKLRKNFPTLQETITTNLFNNKGLDYIRDAIESSIRRSLYSPIKGIPLPTNWKRSKSRSINT